MWPFKKKPVDTRPKWHVSFFGLLKEYPDLAERKHYIYRGNSEADILSTLSLHLFETGNVIRDESGRYKITVSSVDVRPEHSNGDQSEYKVVGLGLLKRV